ncbi:MAG TPA: sensor histidine kinase, partial [Candidatus Babeliaceae bacterium]|nr:sensor histidine kinase [Candidatus Babeliaceae bacterium]
EMVYAATGQYKKAYDYVCQVFKLHDSVMYGKKNKAVRVLEIKYKTAEKDKELAQQQLLIDKKQLLISQQENYIKTKNTWIGSIAGGMLLLTALFTSVYISNRRKRTLQNNKIQLLQQGNDIDKLKATIKGEENERLRMARELHDGISSQLSAVKINFSAIQRKYHELIYDSSFSNGIEQLKDILTELRKTAHNLSPDILHEGGLSEALRVFCNKISASTNIDIIFQQYGTAPLLDYDFELAIYRMVQELVQNVVKHAKATKALVQLDIENDILSITVEDNGTGMPKDILQSTEGMGLRQIKNRVNSMGGKLDIQTYANEGTAIYIEYNITTNKRQS